MIDKGAIAAVAEHVLTGDANSGAKHVLTGPPVISRAEQVQVIEEAIGAPVALREGPRPGCARADARQWQALAR